LDAAELRFVASESAGEVSALLVQPAEPSALLVFGHGAGAGMRHAFMHAMATRLAAHGVATFRYQFPYAERRQSRPDPQPVLLATVRAAVRTAMEAAPSLPVFAGGKSMGGRMTSLAAAAEPLPGVRGLVFFGFPLHPAGRPSIERAAHLTDVTVPLLFLQGTRDALAGLDLLAPVTDRLAGRATLHIIEGADHGFHVQKRSGRTDADVFDELAATAASWMAQRV
jgi:predicted alpha/beta-hydrolase family hydrolase